MSVTASVCAVVLLLLLYPADASRYNPDTDPEEVIYDDVRKILREINFQEPESNDPPPRNLSIVSFSWHDCGSGAIHIKNLDISPSPIHVPGPVTIGFTAALSKDLQAPLKLDIDIHKGLIHVPCRHGMGSCSYDDICKIIQSIPCPGPQEKCHCPFKKGTITLPPTKVNVPSPHEPKFLVRGHYKASAKLSQSGTNVLCVDFSFEITD